MADLETLNEWPNRQSHSNRVALLTRAALRLLPNIMTNEPEVLSEAALPVLRSAISAVSASRNLTDKKNVDAAKQAASRSDRFDVEGAKNAISAVYFINVACHAAGDSENRQRYTSGWLRDIGSVNQENLTEQGQGF